MEVEENPFTLLNSFNRNRDKPNFRFTMIYQFPHLHRWGVWWEAEEVVLQCLDQLLKSRWLWWWRQQRNSITDLAKTGNPGIADVTRYLRTDGRATPVRHTNSSFVSILLAVTCDVPPEQFKIFWKKSGNFLIRISEVLVILPQMVAHIKDSYYVEFDPNCVNPKIDWLLRTKRIFFLTKPPRLKIHLIFLAPTSSRYWRNR